jgi:tRNA(Ile2) C34 agmatinyltransferase TiaS
MCRQDDCELTHCRECGCHMPFAGSAPGQRCQDCDERAWEAEREESPRGLNPPGFGTGPVRNIGD